MGRNIFDMKLGFIGISILIFLSRAFTNPIPQDQDNIKDEIYFEDIDSDPQKEIRHHELILPIKSSSMLKNLFHLPFFVSYKRDSNPHVRVIKSLKNRDQKLDSHIRVMRSDAAADHFSQIRVIRSPEEPFMGLKSMNYDADKMLQDSQMRMLRSAPTHLRVTRAAEADWDEPQVRITRSEENYTPQIRIV